MPPRFPQAQALDCFVPDARQVALSERWLTPHIDSISAAIAEIRAGVDREFVELQRASTHPQAAHLAGLTDIRTYPYGYCDRIRDAVWDAMQWQLKAGVRSDHPFAPIAEFCREGGAMRKIWGELTHGPYLQNAMQLGTYYVDAANDTVDIRKPKLEVKLIADTTFRNIESFEHYFDVVDSYYEWDTYPNLYFPRLAPFFPGIARHRASGVWVFCDVPLPLIAKNLERGGSLAWRFLAESAYARKCPASDGAELLDHYARLVRPADSPDRRPYRLDGDMTESFRRLAAWLQQGLAGSVYMRETSSLDQLRKQLDRGLRAYSLKKARGEPGTDASSNTLSPMEEVEDARETAVTSAGSRLF